MVDEIMNGSKEVLNKIAQWSSIVGIGLYLLYVGQWVGAADEKLSRAESVEESQQQIKERLTRLEQNVEADSETSKARDEAILKAIERLEKKIEDMDEDG